MPADEHDDTSGWAAVGDPGLNQFPLWKVAVEFYVRADTSFAARAVVDTLLDVVNKPQSLSSALIGPATSADEDGQ